MGFGFRSNIGSGRRGGGVAMLLAAATLLSVMLVAAFSGSPAEAQVDPLHDQLGADIDGENAVDLSGGAVAMSADGNTIIVGARFNDDNGSNSGHARVYTFTAGAWTQVGGDIDGENAGDISGTAVAMSADGNTIIIGAPRNAGNGTDSGHARIYTLTAGAWTQVGDDIDGENAVDFSGGAVAMSADGNTVIVGATGSFGNGPFSGHARVYTCLLYTSPSPRDS